MFLLYLYLFHISMTYVCIDYVSSRCVSTIYLLYEYQVYSILECKYYVSHIWEYLLCFYYIWVKVLCIYYLYIMSKYIYYVSILSLSTYYDSICSVCNYFVISECLFCFPWHYAQSVLLRSPHRRDLWRPSDPNKAFYNLRRRQYVSQTPPTSLFLPIPSGRRSIPASPPGCSRGTLQGRTRMKGSGEGSALHRMRSKNPSLSGNPPMKPATIPITAPWETQRNRSGEQPSKNRTQEPACWDLRAIGKSWGLGVFSIKGLRITFLSVSAHSQPCDLP